MQRPEGNRTGENRWPRSGKNSGGCRAGRPSRCAVLNPVPLSKDRRSNLWPVKHVCTTGTADPSATCTCRGADPSAGEELKRTPNPKGFAGQETRGTSKNSNRRPQPLHFGTAPLQTSAAALQGRRGPNRAADPSAGEELKRTTNPKGFAGQRNARHVGGHDPTPQPPALRQSPTANLRSRTPRQAPP